MSRPLSQNAYLIANGATDFLKADPAGSYQFVTTDNFTPNLGHWTPFGNVAAVTQTGNTFQLTAQNNNVSLQVSILSPSCFRVRFNPAANASYDQDNSYAVINRDLGPVTLNILQKTHDLLLIDTGTIQLRINLQPYALQVFRDTGNGLQLIHGDTMDDNQYYNLVFLPGHEVIANFKQTPANAYYFGFGEKAGAQLAKNGFTLTQFNFDNFEYMSGPLPAGEQSGPLNPSEALYCSVPLLIENNPAPQGVNAGPVYSYGLFFDNPSQSYFNIGANDYSNMDGMYYFGALYGELDYYFMLGNQASEVVDQYTQLTGRPTFAPKYVLGYHQGCYGYYDKAKLIEAAAAYREANIPIDGLHIDIDLQNNYRTFTNSNIKFADLDAMFSSLKANGFKCSTNITGMITNNPCDETGNTVPYPTLDEGIARGFFLTNTRVGLPTDGSLFLGEENYGVNYGTNPYKYPPLEPDDQGHTQLGSGGYYPDLGRPEVQTWWGQQYQYLLSAGLEMIWQDMTDPAIYAYYDTPQMQQAANDIVDSNPPYGEAPPPEEIRVLSPWKTAPLDLMVTSFGSQVPHAEVHNAYGLLLSEATYNGLGQLRPQQRNFIIARGGYAGLQRYAALWTGDSASSWDFLRINLPQVLNLGLSGIPISGCDIGGFGPGDGSVGEGQITNYELFTRWMQLGSFLPWYRNHYDGYAKQFQEPFKYAEPVPSNCRKYIELRYRMLQIYYDALYESTQTGMPIARALFLEAQDPGVYDHLDDQFFVGSNILVAPIIESHETARPPTPPVRDIYLPSGSEWYAFVDDDFPLGAPVEGGTLVTAYYAGLDQVPIYIRAGAILPMRQLEQWVGQLESNPLTFNIYPGQDSTYKLYLDDGYTTQYASNNSYRLTEISHSGISNGQNIRIQRVFDNYIPSETFYYVSLLGAEAPQSVTVDGESLGNAGSPETLAQSNVNAYYYNSTIKQVYAKIFDTGPDVTVLILFP
ncbi:TIM-barrel domain-containing protein [Pseudomonas sp. 7-41]|jgi:alpha-glucosidase|uniref:TIM-barrel domain-containing protein n=1 Tax=Pseudomonas sp. 7-41 TaxID=2898483 RepID=UPI001E619B2D|nr:TIM-barrel domain-containing protein [Pseudomonas sp. 7-41]UHH00621.1 DUF4968 domain-containing protein [Pseudomonas sp. 7-41]